MTTEELAAATIAALRQPVDNAIGIPVSDRAARAAVVALDELVRRAEEAGTLRAELAAILEATNDLCARVAPQWTGLHHEVPEVAAFLRRQGLDADEVLYGRSTAAAVGTVDNPSDYTPAGGPGLRSGMAEVDRLTAELAELRTERDRLARVLAVERGDESQAPEGWCLQMDWPDWFHPDSGADVERNERVWRFSVGAAPMQGDFMSALDAMEAADKARGVRHD